MGPHRTTAADGPPAWGVRAVVARVPVAAAGAVPPVPAVVAVAEVELPGPRGVAAARVAPVAPAVQWLPEVPRLLAVPMLRAGRRALRATAAVRRNSPTAKTSSGTTP